MLELKIQCESADEARVYLNAHQYHNLLSDLMTAFRNAQKHGTDADVVRVVTNFYPDICNAVDNSTGAY
jgi:hypothetical protein